MTVWHIIFILAASLCVIALAVSVDFLVDYIPRKKAERQARKKTKAQIDSWAQEMVVVMSRNLKNTPPLIQHRHRGAHRHVKA
jgi:nitrate reductase cytochrome c-type subunit